MFDSLALLVVRNIMRLVSWAIWVISFSLTEGWSGDGHRVIARIASEFLRDSGKNFIADHLTGRDTSKVEKALIDHSTYADTVEWSDDLHFSHTPHRECAQFEIERDCPLVGGARRCIVTAIANYTTRASDVELSVEERGEAIKFLIHFIGDIHNPLHVGFEQDLGGNLIHLSYPPEKSLHNVWDYVLVNRKQVEHGVFKENEEEDAEPWKLSEALLNDLIDSRHSHPYLLNLELESVASEEASRNVAASMASETAMHYTCDIAYKNEHGEWIEKGHALKEAYLFSRSEISMELLKMAGVRLAEILNNIGKLYATRKHELEEGKRAMKRDSESVAPTSNRYLVIDMSMIPDEHLFNEEVDENDEDEVCSKGLAVLKEEEPVRKAETGKVSQSTKRKLRKKRAKYMFEGVDLESVVLIKRRGRFALTGAKLAKAAMVSYISAAEVTVRFADGNEEVFSFDSAHFGFGGFSDALITAALMRIKNVPLDSITLPETPPVPENNPVSSIELTRHYIAPFEGQIKGKDNWQLIYSALPLARIPEPVVVLSKRAKEKAQQKRNKDLKDWEMILGHVPTEEELSALRIQQNFNDICFLKVDMVFLIIHRKNIEDPSRPMVKTNQFYVFLPVENDQEVKVTFLVDNDIVEGDLYSDTAHLILQALDKNDETCKTYFKKRPTLQQEFAEVTSLLFEKDYKRSTLISHIKYFTVFRLDAQNYRKVHWSIHPASADGKIL